MSITVVGSRQPYKIFFKDEQNEKKIKRIDGHEMSSAIIYVFIHCAPGVVDFNTIVFEFF